ncbi:hypothetical protein TNCT_525001 [Trichonephila clavata]|uniref:Uncharacterized protein n=1 Tax=Trichonephila clavata TaxID=2740835 RepID=A0A8X6GHH4_TRICU|nr:hypothetical protein TNCT_525001 [Trichonephila clavata]
MGSENAIRNFKKIGMKKRNMFFFSSFFLSNWKKYDAKKRPQSLERVKEREEKGDCHPQTFRREENSETANMAGSALEIAGRPDQ